MKSNVPEIFVRSVGPVQSKQAKSVSSTLRTFRLSHEKGTKLVSLGTSC